MKFLNDIPFEYHSHLGTIFKSQYSDFRTGIEVIGASSYYDNISSEVAEMIAYHVLNIYPNLNGFRGYDNLTFKY